MDKNICNFIPYHKDYHSIHTINFVLETKLQQAGALKSQSVYKAYYVCSGDGKLHLPDKIVPLKKGDVFFTFPASPFCIESVNNFKYMYISFLGSRANMIMEKLGISHSKFIFSDCAEIFPFWEKGLDANTEISDLITESILLYTFHFLGSRLLPSENGIENSKNLALSIKKFIDDNFSDSRMSLSLISRELSYSEKYISAAFKKEFDIGIAEYLNTVRIQHACTLASNGFTSIYDISLRCGYKDAQYFSKVFKNKMGISPKAHIKQL